MAAAVLRKNTKTETAFIRIAPFKEKFLGNLSQKDLETMLGQDDPVLKVKIKGKHLKTMLKLADFEDPFSNTKDYTTGFALAVSGVEKDGKNYKINTIAVNDDEIYSAAFPESLLKEMLFLPDLRDNLIQIKQTGMTTTQEIISYLNNLLSENKQQAKIEASLYQQQREIRLENNIPPQDN